MNQKAMRLPDYLSYLLEAIHRIQRYTHSSSREAFLAEPR